ncbi:MAG: type II CAAX endopeptidase family protein [Pseudomonadota bacterium]
MEPEKRTNLIVALVFGLVSAFLVSFEGTSMSEATLADLYLRTAQAEARLHAAANALLGDDASGALPDPFQDAELLMTGIQGVTEETRSELLFGMAVAAAAADQPKTARIIESRAGAGPEALLPLRFAWSEDRPAPATLEALEAALDAAALTPWTRDRLRARWMERRGDEADAKALLASQQSADLTWIHELAGVFLGLLFLGLVGLALLILNKRLIHRWSEAPPDYLHARFGATPWETLALFLFWFIASQAGGGALAWSFQGSLSQGALILGAYLFSAVLGLAMIYTFGIRGFSRIGLSAPGTTGLRHLLGMVSLRGRDLHLRAMLWGLAGFAAALPVVWGLSILSLVLVGGDTHPAIPVFIGSESLLDRGMLLVTICLLAPLFEEFLFRGFLWNRFHKMLGVYSATALSALVFAAVHLSVGSFLPLMGLGVILALVSRHAGSLWASVFTHTLWNLMNILFLQLLYR